ncbi:hypothetical protein F53441_13461 [Fusarium austroafricanum]|uniref:Uncharacterized protein n=1 Tax=Fusarium austroafricanum TaxID=2364996 RepID=A0A8H4JQG8_9HYPO|nr:hypothetical protein F53441_13461 [Fusarium austroafricanum]
MSDVESELSPPPRALTPPSPSTSSSNRAAFARNEPLTSCRLGVAPSPSVRRAARRAERARRTNSAAAATAQDVVERRSVPCLPCLNSALAGSSKGECFNSPDSHRYERCEVGGSCRPIPVAALPVALFFLDYVQQPSRSIVANEKNKRRIAVKVVLRGCADGTFPSAGDPRLA